MIPTIGTKIQAGRQSTVGYRFDGYVFDRYPRPALTQRAADRRTRRTAPRQPGDAVMISRLETALPSRVTKTTLYRIVGWLLRVYVVSLALVGVYSFLWVLEVAGMLPGHVLSTAWFGVAAIGLLFLVLSIPLYYRARTTEC